MASSVWDVILASKWGNRLPGGASGKLWAQNSGFHHIEQGLIFSSSLNSANLSPVLYAERILSCIKTARLAKAHFKCQAAFKIITQVANPLCPWFSWFWCSDSKYLTFKSTFYSCKTLAFVCLVGCFLFFADFVLVCSCCPVPLTILQRTSCSGSFQKASPAAVLMPTLFLLLSAFTWHEGAFWKAKRQCAKPLEARVSVGEAEPMQ